MITATVLGISLYAFVGVFVVGMCRAASAGNRLVRPNAGESSSDPSPQDVETGQMPAGQPLPSPGLGGLRLPQPSLETFSAPGTIYGALIEE
jgi:hypothetical protein